MQVRYEEMESPVVGCRQLPQKVSDLQDGSVELHAWPRFVSRWVILKPLSLLHDGSLALFGQAD